MITYVYVDAFNLYYGACKRHPELKWLNIHELCRRLLPRECEIRKLRYFTAMVTPRSDDPGQKQRQEFYLRALRTIPFLEVHFGTFMTHPVKMRLKEDPSKGVWVLKTEEKGSDVNLATHLVNDAHRGKFQAAAVVSNDSDLVEPIKIVRGELGLEVSVLNPHPRHPSVELQANSDRFISIREGNVKLSQFPDEIRDVHGKVTRPPEWR